MIFKFLTCFLLAVNQVHSRGPQHVTCGSVVKLINSGHKIRLHSHDVKYGSGSGQQSVTGITLSEDVNSHWTIKGPGELNYCTRGEPVQCGQKIRLEHLTTHRNLHSHLFSSPLSNAQEVSAFGESGVGDTGDVWSVICEGDFWNRDGKVRFKHQDTGVYLAASGHAFGRPINGQMEIVGSSSVDGSTSWTAQEGVYIHQSDFNPNKSTLGHDEL
ncbi:stromal cell-derived factor 2 [Eurytemora carolleeae]|uniref:stromal cell-derived factor 2 n=1 Tax=Eurytemora carolleeae TaxID=1294199 RepID=UPI000C779FC3|nr:stromal cell-derived factor 2 [Eurytemora carolleeae]|eukprot:XP_023327953.1 stromal cell-derived factor 2-like [Eurytemora affinis]